MRCCWSGGLRMSLTLIACASRILLVDECQCFQETVLLTRPWSKGQHGSSMLWCMRLELRASMLCCCCGRVSMCGRRSMGSHLGCCCSLSRHGCWCLKADAQEFIRPNALIPLDSRYATSKPAETLSLGLPKVRGPPWLKHNVVGQGCEIPAIASLSEMTSAVKRQPS